MGPRGDPLADTMKLRHCLNSSGVEFHYVVIRRQSQHRFRTGARVLAKHREVGRRIVDHEQRSKQWAQYGEALLRRLAEDLTARFGKGFWERNLLAMREFHLALIERESSRI
jgi:hypothetical protein